MEQRLSLITLGVADIAASRQFYEGALGWKPAAAMPEVVFYQLPGLGLALHPRAMLAEDANLPATGGGFSGFSLALNQRSEADVDALCAEVERAGAKILKRPQKTHWGGYHFYFSDPDGFAWEVAYNADAEIKADGGTYFRF